MRALVVFPLVLLAGAATGQSPKPLGNLKEVMRSVLLRNSNVILGVQQKPPKNDVDWQAVGNAAAGIEETVSLILMPGRVRSNGQPVPVQASDFARFAQSLVPAGQACLKAAQAKDLEKVANCTDGLTDACDNCHKVYRDQR